MREARLKSHGAFTSCWRIVAAGRDCPVDIIFVLDESDSLKQPTAAAAADNFDRMKTFVSNVVDKLDGIDSGVTRVGALAQATKIGEEIELHDHSTTYAFQTDLATFSYTGGKTKSHKGLVRARKYLLTPTAGDRPAVDNVVVLLTAGPADDTATQARIAIHGF